MTTKNKSGDDCVGQEFTITREFDAPRELVWQACTDSNHLAQWWGPKGFSNPVCEWDARPGGKIHVVMRGPDGTDYPMGGEVREVMAPEKLVTVTGALDERGKFLFEFLHTLTLAECNGKTKLTMHSRVISATADAARYIGGFEMGMTLSLERLGEFLAGQVCPPFVITREFNAPRELVWKAWTEREQMMQWFGPKGCTIPVAKMDFRVDGEFHYCMRMPDGNEMWGKWIFREIVAPEKIVLANSFADKDGNVKRPPFPGAWSLQMLTETTFSENDGKTTITLKWFPLDATAEEIEHFKAMRGSFAQGWKGTFDQLADYLAR